MTNFVCKDVCKNLSVLQLFGSLCFHYTQKELKKITCTIWLTYCLQMYVKQFQICDIWKKHF